MNKEKHKATIETMINTAALAITSFGVMQLTKNIDGWEAFVKGLLLVLFGATLEYFKYKGRSKKLW